MANKAYKYRIYPNKEQEELIQKTFDCVRFVYNHFLEDRINAYKENGESRSFFQQNKMLTELKQEYPWLKEPDKNALQCSLRNLNAAYQNFFRRVKNGGAPGFPRFKRKKAGRKSYSTAANGNLIRVEGNKIRLPKIGFVRAKISREIQLGHRIISATVSQRPSGKYFISILTEFESETPDQVLDYDNSIGLDYSSPHFYVDSNGKKADMPHFYRDAEKQLAREQRKLSGMAKGSNNYNKQKIKVAKAFEKIHDSRMDWQHKESTRLSNAYDLIAVEDINYQDMAKGLHSAKATNDNGFGQFRMMLAYKMAERGKKFITIDKWFPSSKTCRFCGHVNSELTLNDRLWVCPCCGEEIDRDINAAINIRNQGVLNAS